jgi:hypothetical protein
MYRESDAGSVLSARARDDQGLPSENVTEILANPLSQQLLASAIPARFASTALDGDPRV